jgi:hypothetical protein
MKSRLNSENACCILFSLSSSRFLSINLKFKIYETIILPVVLYGCAIWSLTLREEHAMRMYKNRVLRRIFGPKREKVAGNWSRLRNEELRNLYASLNTIRVNK